MIILGLGTNIGDRLTNFRQAIAALKNIANLTIQRVSPVYMSDAMLPENAPSDWDQPYLNLALSIKTDLKPEVLLTKLKEIELSMGRVQKRHWGPRVIDIDILAWDDLIIQSEKLTIPHANLHHRPFALWPLIDVAPQWIFPNGELQGQVAATVVENWGSRFTGEALFHTRQIHQRVDTPQLVGIVNVTPNSFSDGGNYLVTENALSHIKHLTEAGAEVIDIGAESTAPTAEPIDAATEWQRLEPLLQALKKETYLLPPKISIDTRHSKVAARALDFGIDWINDVSGLNDESMLEVVKHSQIDCVIMHHVTIPARATHLLPRHEDPVQTVYRWAENKLAQLTKHGISSERIIFDPGIGFGKYAEQSLKLLQYADVFKQLGVRILIGHSRKKFLSLYTDKTFADRDIETLALTLQLAHKNIDYLRVHNVEMSARGLKVKL